MPSRNPVEQLLAHYPLEDAALIFRILYPLLSDQGRAYLPALEAKVASRKSSSLSLTPTCADSPPRTSKCPIINVDMVQRSQRPESRLPLV